MHDVGAADRETSGIGAEIGGLADLPLPALRQLWSSHYRSEPPVRMSRELLVQAIAYRLQEEALGGLSRGMRIKLAKEASVHGRGKAGAPRPTAVHRRIKPGTRFLREWHGRTHEVTATADGRYSYRGSAYRSLSAIARAITGTRWSGPAFFGIARQPKASRDG